MSKQSKSESRDSGAKAKEKPSSDTRAIARSGKERQKELFERRRQEEGTGASASHRKSDAN